MWHLAQHNDFVVALLGYLAIFVVLALIYIACLVMGSISRKLMNEVSDDKSAKKANAPAPAPTAPSAPEQNAAKPLSEFADRRAAVAAISAAIAADLGTDTSKIRITSIKKLG
jgi:Na+-transporting methylmalonyl-CoA/oxaloacetate decarboxylase gamma subunit